MDTKTCFFITPIGETDSPERIQSDALRDNVLKFSCEPFGLELVRADQIKGDSDINQDVVDYIKSAEICVIDLTGLNPNVMFEFGIRYQTTLPAIVLARKGTKLPFDIITRRTIFFEDIDTAAGCNSLIYEIREHIKQFEANGYRKISSEPTLTEIYKLLEMIDKKVSSPISVKDSNTVNVPNSPGLDQLLSNLDPSEAFRLAYSTNQIKAAEDILELLKDQPYEYYFNKVCALTTKGSLKAMAELESTLPKVIEEKNIESIIEIIGCLVTCYMRRDLAKDKIDTMNAYFDQAYSIVTSNRDRAAVLNQKQRLLAGAGRFEEAKDLANQIIQLYDEEPAYYFNYATVLVKLNDSDGAKEQVKRCVDLSDNTTPHEEGLMLACQLFKDSISGPDKDFYEKCLSKLKAVNPYRARLLQFV